MKLFEIDRKLNELTAKLDLSASVSNRNKMEIEHINYKLNSLQTEPDVSKGKQVIEAAMQMSLSSESMDNAQAISIIE